MMEMVDCTQPKKTARGGSQTMFPGRLHELLEYVESQGLDYIVSWVGNGTAFMVHNQGELLKLLSFFFGQTKYRSFTRQLNMWSFQREEEGPFKGSFSNPYFVKHDRSLCAKMRRHEPKLRGNISSQATTSKTLKVQASLEGSSMQPFENMKSLSPSHSSTTESEKLSPCIEPAYNPIVDFESLPIGFKSSNWLNDDEMSSSLLFNERMSPLKQEQSIHVPCLPMMQAPMSWISAQSPLSSTDHVNNLDGSLFHLDTTDALEPTPILEVSQMPGNSWGESVEMLRDDVFPIIPQLEELESRFQFPGSSTSLPIITPSNQQAWRGEFCSLSQSLEHDDEAQYLLKLLQTER